MLLQQSVDLAKPKIKELINCEILIIYNLGQPKNFLNFYQRFGLLIDTQIKTKNSSEGSMFHEGHRFL